MVLAVAAIIGQGTDGVGEFGVVGGDGSGVAERADIFCRIEAESGCVAERACGAAGLVGGADGLGVVLDDFQAVGMRHTLHFGIVAGASVEVDGEYRAGARCDGGFDTRCIEVEGVGVGFHQHWHKSVVCDGED